MYRKLRNIINRILKKLRYSILIRSLITGYLKIVLASYLNFAIVTKYNIYIYNLDCLSQL